MIVTEESAQSLYAMSESPQTSSKPRLDSERSMSLQRAVFGAPSTSSFSLESLPLTEGGFRPRPSYGSVFSYYHMLRSGSFSTIKVNLGRIVYFVIFLTVKLLGKVYLPKTFKRSNINS